MKMCPYCGRKIEKQATVCNHCYAAVAAVEAEKTKEQPKKAEKKPEKE